MFDLFGGTFILSLVVVLTRSRYVHLIAREITARQVERQVCHYDGHCPTGMTCAIAPSSVLGICESFLTSQEDGDKDVSLQACVDACLPELEFDEYFAQERWPIVREAHNVQSLGRPHGCLLTYTREVLSEAILSEDLDSVWNDISPKMRQWNQTRLRHIVRVDPADELNLHDKRWNAYCLRPCQKDADCKTSRDNVFGKPQGYVCDDGACHRNPKYWNADLDPEKPELVFVTGASWNYFPGLQNLAASIRYWAPHHKLVVYNLGGLDAQMINEIQSWQNVIAVEWRSGVPDDYPPHVHVGKLYAWKPIIIHETLKKYKAIFWLDAGSTLAGPVATTERFLERDGIFLVKGQDLDMKSMSHNKTFDWFNVTKDDEFEGHFGGNTQAHLYPSRYFDSIVVPNYECAMSADCIAPEDSDRSNHRYDQTTLSILAYHPKVKVPHHTEHVAVARYQLSQDLEAASYRFIWTARQECTYYVEREEMINARK